MQKNIKKLYSVFVVLFIALALAACAGGNRNTATTEDASQVMRQVFADYEEAVGTLDNTTFGQITEQMSTAMQTLDLIYLNRLKTIDREALSEEDRYYYDIFTFDRELGVQGNSLLNARFGAFTTPITHFYNFFVYNAEDAGATQEDWPSYHTHIEVIREYTAWVRNLHVQYNKGMAEGIQLPKVLISRMLDTTTAPLNVDNDAYGLLKLGLNDIEANSDQFEAHFVAEYRQVVNDAVDATSDILAFIGGEYYDNARGTDSINDRNIGWGDLPNGHACYKWHLDRNSTTGKPADELHALGVELVADAKSEMIRVAEGVASKRGNTITEDWRNAEGQVIQRTFTIVNANGDVNLNEFFDYLNSEKFFYGRDGNTVSCTAYADVCATASNTSACEAAVTDYNIFKDDANAVLGDYFKTIETDYSVVPIPADRELYDGVASYSSSRRTFNLNTNPNYGLQKWNISTLLLHEGAPGHHFQNAYAIEFPAENKPSYFEDIYYTAYGEGWALYTEWLGEVMGIYGDLNAEGKPTFVNAKGMCKVDVDYDTFQGGIYTDMEECNMLQYFGALNEAQLRNMRLVVDTGIHSKGWSIQDVRDYMSDNSALGVGDIESESYRYAAYVAQAVSYKSGYIVIMELLEEAQAKLGNDFNWADFHDQLLKYGSVPMAVYDNNLRDWIDAQ